VTAARRLSTRPALAIGCGCGVNYRRKDLPFARRKPMPLLHEKQGHVAIVTLSRPQARNAWGEDYNDGLKELLPQLEDDGDIRCVILTGDDKGGAFSAGADLKNPKTHTNNSAAEFIESLPKRRRFQAMNLLADFPKPLVAAVNGYAVGIGCIVTYCCDLIVASEKAEWRLPQVGLGILPAQGGTVRLARWIGRGEAMKVALGFPLKAEEAHRIGLAQWLVPHEQLMGKALQVAEHVAALPPLAARLVKEAVVFGQDAPLREAANADLYRFMALELTEDKKEAHQAWRERRKPVLTGR
jgi:enoyl-CoA hydratase/carnithine racemase